MRRRILPFVVRLTHRGKRAFDRMTPAHAAWIDEMFRGLDRTEKTALYELLGRLKLSLAPVGDEAS